jgi:hypothetical protein
MSTFQTREGGVAGIQSRVFDRASLFSKRESPAYENNPKLLQNCVTYDTFDHGQFWRAFAEAIKALFFNSLV